MTKRKTRDPLELPPAPRRWWIGAVYVLLFALSVPWYLPASAPVPTWLGLPYWVVIAIAGSTGVALFTALVVARFWPTEGDLEQRVGRQTDETSGERANRATLHASDSSRRGERS